MQASNPYSPPVQILRRPAVVARTGLPTRSIYRLMQRGAFPRPVPISALSVGWLAHEIDEWIAGRIAARDANAMRSLCCEIKFRLRQTLVEQRQPDHHTL